MEYELGVACRPHYLRPSIQGLNFRTVERDSMDEVVEYIDSLLDETEMMSQVGSYWSYYNSICPDPDWENQRFGVIEFQMDDGYQWSIDILEKNKIDKDNYPTPKIKYLEGMD